ncbi:MAG: hypothetical protein LBL20_05720 [Treponema sp.]|nr:hypothetical protein [Treponema sp.]
MDLKAEFLFCPLYGVEKESPHGVAIKDHLLPVCPRSNMIRGVGLEYSISPHMKVYGGKLKNAVVDLDFLLKNLSSVPELSILNYRRLKV